jgi:hypothetical protein
LSPRLRETLVRLAPSVEVGEQTRRGTFGASFHEEERRVSFDDRSSSVAPDGIANEAISLVRGRLFEAPDQVEGVILAGTAGEGGKNDDERGNSQSLLSSQSEL